MLNILCGGVDKIVSSGIDGTILILPLIVLIWVLIGQAKDCIRIVRRVLREGVEEGGS